MLRMLAMLGRGGRAKGRGLNFFVLLLIGGMPRPKYGGGFVGSF